MAARSGGGRVHRHGGQYRGDAGSVLHGGSALTGEGSYPAFAARFPWYGGDLQTVRNTLTGAVADLSRWPHERLEFSARDGSGDRLLGALHRPEGSGERPLVALLHGLTGSEDSHYVRETARYLLDCGYPVLRLNLRGAGPSRETCRGHYCAGSSGDLASALASLDGTVVAQGVVLVGYSLGGNIVLKHLAETPARPELLGGVAVSAPIDLAAAARRLMQSRNVFYHRWLLGLMKREALSGAAEVSDRERRAIRDARSVVAYDDRFIAPRFGFDGADDYYRRCSAGGMLGRISRPALLIHAGNDPWIPRHAYREAEGGLPSRVDMLLADGGGHVGFHGRNRETPWHNLCIRTFIDRVSRTSNDRIGPNGGEIGKTGDGNQHDG